MIVVRQFVFLHLHKSGGTFVNKFLYRFFPDAALLGYHLPAKYLPREFAGLPQFGLVRNPWDYYVSWYSFQSGRLEPNALFRCVSHEGRLDFPATIGNLATLGEQPELLARVRSLLPDRIQAHGLNLTKSCLDELAGRRIGFYSFLYDRLYGPESSAVIGRMELLRSELSAFLRRVGIELTQPMREYLQCEPPANRSAHRPYPEFYDDETRNLVASRDGRLIEKHRYEFARETAESPESNASPAAAP